MSTERMRALVDAIDAREWSRAVLLAEQLSEECDRSGVLAQWLEVRPLLDAVAGLAEEQRCRLEAPPPIDDGPARFLRDAAENARAALSPRERAVLDARLKRRRLLKG